MERKHLIEMIDAGITTPYGERIIIMEMGVDSFHDRLYDRLAVQYDSDEHMANAIRGLARPLFEFHNIAIHMDVNPRNYLYVKKDGGHLVVKLIDFEGAKLVSTSNKNECVVIGEEHALSPEYTGPEYYDEQGQAISTKFDIWSMGIMLIEIAFDQIRAEKRETPLSEDERKSRLFAIGNLFLGFTRNRLGTQPGIFKETQIVYSAGTEWIEQHQSAIETVLHIWMKYPRTALLVTNLLNLERKKRLTAQGILNYIDGLCQIGEFKEKVIKKQQKEMKRLKRDGTAKLNACETE
ncbi:hypothetical protein niasHT_021057 [Heterodera trifolii]|uniref:Protein kinase domain-containing protein n=1 Tax=Heterodera trifolii TaxID=157864 RepID=A0ABD2KDJ4_9BILA